MADLASTRRLPPEFHRVTGINESMKTSQSNRLNISVSFNKHIRDVFYCKHLDCSSVISRSVVFLWTLKIECLKEPIKKQTPFHWGENVSKENETKRFMFELYEMQGLY